MYKIPLSEIKEKVVASGKIDAEEFENKVKAKINELSGLISEEGAAHIIANELAIELTPKSSAELKIKEIYAGMRNVTANGKVVRKFETREFAKGDSTGKVCSLVMGDETATIRVVFWNEQVDLLSNVNENDIIAVKNAYVRENRGGKEIHLGDKGSIDVNPEGVVIENVRQGNSFSRASIKDLQPGQENVELLATVIQVFDPRFFDVHPETGRRLRDAEPGVTPVTSYVLNAVVDDGTGNIRCVFWKNQTDNLAKGHDVASYKDNPAGFEDIKTELLGEQCKLMGKVQRNEMFDRLEFNVQIVTRADPNEELKKLE